jgi:hypothetical protein
MVKNLSTSNSMRGNRAYFCGFVNIHKNFFQVKKGLHGTTMGLHGTQMPCFGISGPVNACE